jgi:hypothetical protein
VKECRDDASVLGKRVLGKDGGRQKDNDGSEGARFGLMVTEYEMGCLITVGEFVVSTVECIKLTTPSGAAAMVVGSIGRENGWV